MAKIRKWLTTPWKTDTDGTRMPDFGAAQVISFVVTHDNGADALVMCEIDDGETRKLKQGTTDHGTESHRRNRAPMGVDEKALMNEAKRLGASDGWRPEQFNIGRA